MGFTVEQGNATFRLFDWLGAGRNPDRKLDADQVVADLMVLGKAAGNRMLMSVNEDTVRAAVARVNGLLHPVSGEDAEPEVPINPVVHNLAKGTRVRVDRGPEGGGYKPYDGVIDGPQGRLLRTDESARYYVKHITPDSAKGVISTEFEHHMTVIPNRKMLVEAFKASRAKQEESN